MPTYQSDYTGPQIDEAVGLAQTALQPPVEVLPFDVATEQQATLGELAWNSDEGTLDLGINGTALQLGQDVVYHARNATASPIAKGTAVGATGTLGNSGRITIAPFIADGNTPAKYFLGITGEAIAAGEDGKVVHFGKIRQFNTSAFAEGDVLWVSPTTPGALTATMPTAPEVKLPVAIVITDSATTGTLFIRATVSATAEQGALADSAVQSATVRNIVTLTQTEYDALDPADPTVLYVVVDDPEEDEE
jgi:hypothetical protein